MMHPKRGLISTLLLGEGDYLGEEVTFELYPEKQGGNTKARSCVEMNVGTMLTYCE